MAKSSLSYLDSLRKTTDVIKTLSDIAGIQNTYATIDNPYAINITYTDPVFDFILRLDSGDIIIFKKHIAQVFKKNNGNLVFSSITDWGPIDKENQKDFIKESNNRFIYKIYRPLSNQSLSLSRFQKDSTKISEHYEIIYENKG